MLIADLTDTIYLPPLFLTNFTSYVFYSILSCTCCRGTESTQSNARQSCSVPKSETSSLWGWLLSIVVCKVRLSSQIALYRCNMACSNWILWLPLNYTMEATVQIAQLTSTAAATSTASSGQNVMTSASCSDSTCQNIVARIKWDTLRLPDSYCLYLLHLRDILLQLNGQSQWTFALCVEKKSALLSLTDLCTFRWGLPPCLWQSSIPVHWRNIQI